MNWPILTTPITTESDVVAVRHYTHRIAELIGCDVLGQTRIATAVSEIARNAFGYGSGGKAEFYLTPDKSSFIFMIKITDHGPGIADLEAILGGRYRSPTGMGLGIPGARRLADRFVIASKPGETIVELGKTLPASPAFTREKLEEVVKALTRERRDDPLALLRDQNRELLLSLQELRSKQDEMAHLNDELEDTNRGVVALYAELDERAEQLRQASEIKSRFLSHMSHEFRTPLNSILALSRMLLDQTDGTLEPEQTRQVGYIRKSAESLTDLVNDLLDLAKVEAGKLDVRPVGFTVTELFGGLRGALKPLQTREQVELVFISTPGLPTLYTDEGKLAQILRNFISNALKYTEKGEVRVSATLLSDNRIEFAVQDTGIGIAPDDIHRVFEEFTQVPNALQQGVKGTGLGLPLARKLAKLLFGDVSVESTLGAGSIFRLVIPARLETQRLAEDGRSNSSTPQQATCSLLIVDDDETFRYVLRQMLMGSGDRFEIIEAVDGVEGLKKVQAVSPDVILLDLQMPNMNGFDFYEAFKKTPGTSGIPVIVSTSLAVTSAVRARLEGIEAILPKENLTAETLLAAIGAARTGSR
ncbi:ATP-binding protein [Lacibacterium aquatile]|uniref:histidine kinase n=1 Tax=Lacibacterium aquatile TaxID=1168082 RepID=A0ABW5DL89_9PROT